MKQRKLVRNFDSFKEYYSIESKEFCSSDSEVEIIGWYKIIDDTICALFVENSGLCIFWKNEKYFVEDHDSMTVFNTKFSTVKKIVYMKNGQPVFDLEYEVEENYCKNTSLDYIEDEDFDWGLFLSNVINNDARKKNIIAILG